MVKNKEPKSLLVRSCDLSWDDLTKGQKGAVKRFDEWFFAKKKKKDQIFRIGAASGAGKSSLIPYILEKYNFTNADCMVVAYTGQAVNVLRQNGVIAKTIHSSFMHAKDTPLMRDGEVVKKRGVPIMVTKWVPISKLPSSVKLIIVDEASFVSTDMEELMAKYDVPILEIGDPFQLPPVIGTQCFRLGNLNYYIEGVVRQKESSLIYRLSRDILNGVAVNLSDYHGEVQFLYAQPNDLETFLLFRPFFYYADLVITATNKQRQAIVDLYREYILKATSPYPLKGEKMICRKNEWNMMLGPYPLTNGTIGRCLHTVGRADVDKRTNTFSMDFRPEFIDNMFFDNLLCDSEFLREPFGNDKMKSYPTLGSKFEYAHAITTHLCQGCTANRVVFIDNFNRNEEYHMRNRYTAVTRAKVQLIYIIPRSNRYPGWFDLCYPKEFDLSGIL